MEIPRILVLYIAVVVVALQITIFNNTGLEMQAPSPLKHPAINAAHEEKRLQKQVVSCNSLVEKAFAADGTAETGNSIITVPFSFKFVIVSKLLICVAYQSVHV